MTGHPDFSRLASAIPEQERRGILAHLRDCRDCREAMAAADPSSLFALLALREAPAAALESVSRAVRSELVQGRASRLDAWRERGLPRALPLGLAAAAAAMFLVAGLRGPTSSDTGPPVAAYAAEGRADVQVTETPGPAQVVDLTVGDTQVVMIFATEMEL